MYLMNDWTNATKRQYFTLYDSFTYVEDGSGIVEETRMLGENHMLFRQANRKTVELEFVPRIRTATSW